MFFEGVKYKRLSVGQLSQIVHFAVLGILAKLR